MKNVIFCFLFVASIMAFKPAEAQVASMIGSNSLTLDTLTNADASTFSTGKTSTTAIYFQVKLTKINGTVAGKISWNASLDNVTFFTVDTTALTNATANYGRAFFKGAATATNVKYPFMQAVVTTTGTSSASVAIKKGEAND